MINSKYDFLKLDRAQMMNCVDDLVAIDSRSFAAGLLEQWEVKHFLLDLPGKWRLSTIIKCKNTTVGYRIVSENWKLIGYAHTHRTVIEPEFRRCGLAAESLNLTIQQVKSDGFDGISVFINPDNKISQKFYLENKFQHLSLDKNGNQLWVLDF